MITLSEPVLGCSECYEVLPDCWCGEWEQDYSLWALMLPTTDFFASFNEESMQAAWDAPSAVSPDFFTTDLLLNLRTVRLYASQEWVLADKVADFTVDLCCKADFPPPRLARCLDGFVVIDGHHRLAAALAVGLPTMMCKETLIVNK